MRSICLDIAAEAERLTIAEVGKHPMDKPRTGRMAKSWYVKVDEPNPVTGSMAFVVGNSRKYAKFVDEGTQGPYTIRARSGRRRGNSRSKGMLYFRDRSGVWRITKEVRHPGIRNPYRILRRSVSTVMQRRLR
jgi:hypothetical protein